MKKDVMNLPLEEVEEIINTYLKEEERDSLWDVKCFVRDLIPRELLHKEIIVETYGTDIRITNVLDRWKFKSIHVKYKRVSDCDGCKKCKLVFYKSEFEKSESIKTLNNYCPADVDSTVTHVTRLHDIYHGLFSLYCRFICSAKSYFTISYELQVVKVRRNVSA